ncbi:MAG: pilus assembly protein TadG-related protein [Actinomycetota bacterium]
MNLAAHLRAASMDDSGVTAVIVAIVAVVLFGFAALAIDVGRMFEQRRELQRTADASALSGASKYAAGNTATAGDPCGADALACANYYVDQNPAHMSPIDARRIDVPTACTRVIGGATYPCVHSAVESQNFEFTFAKVLGFDSRTISAEATAIAGSGAPEGARLIPWIVMDCPNPSAYPDESSVTGNDSCPYAFSGDFNNGPFIDLYESPGGGERGNYNAANFQPGPDCPATADGHFDKGGAPDYREFLKGTAASVEACAVAKGARISSKPGFMGSNTDTYLDQRNGRGVETCMDETGFREAVTVTDASKGLISINDYDSPCLVAVSFVAHANEGNPDVGRDVPGGCCIAALQHPDPEARLAPFQGRESEMVVRRFGLFYLTARGSDGAPYHYRGILLKTVDSLETELGSTPRTPTDGICVVKLVE